MLSTQNSSCSALKFSLDKDILENDFAVQADCLAVRSDGSTGLALQSRLYKYEIARLIACLPRFSILGLWTHDLQSTPTNMLSCCALSVWFNKHKIGLYIINLSGLDKTGLAFVHLALPCFVHLALPLFTLPCHSSSCLALCSPYLAFVHLAFAFVHLALPLFTLPYLCSPCLALLTLPFLVLPCLSFFTLLCLCSLCFAFVHLLLL